MKKIFFIGLACLMVVGLCACGNSTSSTTTSDTPVNEIVVGGWEERVDQTVTDELRGIFERGVKGTQYEGYVPVKLLATQVVSGTNFKFLCDNGEEIVIYQDLDLNCSIYSNNGDTQQEKSTVDSQTAASQELSDADIERIVMEHCGVAPESVSFFTIQRGLDDGRKEIEVEFYVNNVEYSYTLDSQGNIVEYESDIED